MQNSGNKPQSVRRRVVSSNAVRTTGHRMVIQNAMRQSSSQKEMSSSAKARPAANTIRISKNRTMAGSSMASKSRMTQPAHRIIERSAEPEIIAPMMDDSYDSVPEDVELLPSSDMGSELMTTNVSKMSAREIKERAIAKALSEAAHPHEKKVVERPMRSHFNWPRVILAFACATAAIFAVVYFVNINSPDISLKVAAMQNGIDASFPSYVPRDFNISDITSENGKITLNFKNNSTNDSFAIIEEKSVWDSNTLMNNYVREEYGDDYSVIREQGLTLYMSGSGDAAWVNGGVVYKLKVQSGSLTKKQIKAIAVSL